MEKNKNAKNYRIKRVNKMNKIIEKKHLIVINITIQEKKKKKLNPTF